MPGMNSNPGPASPILVSAFRSALLQQWLIVALIFAVLLIAWGACRTAISGSVPGTLAAASRRPVARAARAAAAAGRLRAALAVRRAAPGAAADARRPRRPGDPAVRGDLPRLGAAPGELRRERSGTTTPSRPPRRRCGSRSASGCGCSSRCAAGPPGSRAWPAWPGGWSSGCSARRSAGSSRPASPSCSVRRARRSSTSWPGRCSRCPSGPGTGPRLGRLLLGGTGAFFLGMALLQAWPGRGFWQGTAGGQLGSLTAMIASMAGTSQPPALHAIVAGFGNFTAAHGFAVNLVAVIALTLIGAGLLSPPRSAPTRGSRWIAVVAGAAFCLADWVLVEDLGLLRRPRHRPELDDPADPAARRRRTWGSRPAPARRAGRDRRNRPSAAARQPDACLPGGRAVRAPPEPAGNARRAAPAGAPRRTAPRAGAPARRGAGPGRAPGSGRSASSWSAPRRWRSPPPTGTPTRSPPRPSRAPPASSTCRPPNFTLTSQDGRPVSLSSLRGKVVLLTFLDPVCTTDCPLIAQEMRSADAMLGGKAGDTELVAVVANPTYLSTAYTRAFTAQENLSQVPNWLFLTGSLSQLKSVWHDYGIEVENLPAGAMAAHNDLAFVISADGQLRQEISDDPGPGTPATKSSFAGPAGRAPSCRPWASRDRPPGARPPAAGARRRARGPLARRSALAVAGAVAACGSPAPSPATAAGDGGGRAGNGLDGHVDRHRRGHLGDASPCRPAPRSGRYSRGRATREPGSSSPRRASRTTAGSSRRPAGPTPSPSRSAPATTSRSPRSRRPRTAAPPGRPGGRSTRPWRPPPTRSPPTGPSWPRCSATGPSRPAPTPGPRGRRSPSRAPSPPPPPARDATARSGLTRSRSGWARRRLLAAGTCGTAGTTAEFAYSADARLAAAAPAGTRASGAARRRDVAHPGQGRPDRAVAGHRLVRVRAARRDNAAGRRRADRTGP